MQQNKLYVGNFPYSVDESQLRDLFSQYGDITDLALIMDRETGRPKGFAFVTFATQAAAEKALELNGRDLGGRALKVNVAMERERHRRERRPHGTRRHRGFLSRGQRPLRH